MYFNKIKELTTKEIFLISIVASIILTISIASIMSMIFHGYVTIDYIITSFICSSIVAAVIVHIILGLTNELKVSEDNLLKSNMELSKALSEIKTLGGLLPICSSCKKIRDDKGYWNNLEAYIESHSDASFTHGMCTECSEKLYGEEDWYINFKKE